MMDKYQILTLNQISAQGLHRFPAARYNVGKSVEQPEGIILRSFDIPDTNATHLRFEVVTNQCTGGPDFAGEQDADPRAGTDCTTNSPQARIVRAAEFQVFEN